MNGRPSSDPGRSLREGDGAVFIENELECEVLTVKEDGNRIVRFYFKGIWEEVLEKAGHVPLAAVYTRTAFYRRQGKISDGVCQKSRFECGSDGRTPLHVRTFI